MTRSNVTTVIGQTDKTYTGNIRIWKMDNEERTIIVEQLLEREDKFHISTMNKSTGIGMKFGLNRAGMIALASMFAHVLNDLDQIDKEPDDAA